MIEYTFNINEEIARWVTEVYIRHFQKIGWWIAFTNPIAGPWKKITALDESGIPVEIYRFEREGERPDLIIVNDNLKVVIIVEAKDFVQKLTSTEQMVKSIRVIKEITSILNECTNEHWFSRKNYKMIPSFLWYTENDSNIYTEDETVRNSFNLHAGSGGDKLLNIIITKDQNGELINNFIYNSNITKELTI